MYRKRIQSMFAVVLAVCCLVTSSLAYAQVSHPLPLATDEPPEPTAEMILVDVVFLRPLGIAATVVGSAVFVAGLIFTIPTRSVDTAAQRLVVDPAKYTFVRPVGWTEFGGDYESQYTNGDAMRR